jgi:mono/diheme cytochrome c family protein
MVAAGRPFLMTAATSIGCVMALALALSAAAPPEGAGQAQGSSQAQSTATRSAGAKSADQKPQASLALGKKVFVERCAKCHGEDGSAALAEGLPLNKRPLSEEKLTKNVNGRLKDASEEERRAVLEYIKSFRKS